MVNGGTGGIALFLALSGGVDSVVLFYLLNHLPASQRPELVIAHVNHHLRQESAEEEDFVRSLGDRF